MSCWGIVLMENIPDGSCPSEKLSWGCCTSGKLSWRGVVLVGSHPNGELSRWGVIRVGVFQVVVVLLGVVLEPSRAKRKSPCGCQALYPSPPPPPLTQNQGVPMLFSITLTPPPPLGKVYAPISGIGYPWQLHTHTHTKNPLFWALSVNHAFEWDMHIYRRHY